MQEFDPEKLEEFDGRDGRSCYVAVQGKVYDLSDSSLWKTGKHMGRHTAGRELDQALENAPHGEEMLKKFRQVGIIKKRPEKKQPPKWAALLLKQHPHPVIVHFPQALLFLAPLFLALFYYTGNVYFERTCYYLGVTGLLAAIPAVLTGFFHWIYKYAGSTRKIFLLKMSLSLLLFMVTSVVIFIHTGRGILPPSPVDTSMVILYLILMPLSIATGHTGGKIVFG